MNPLRIALAALTATIVYFVIGGIAFTSPVLRNEFTPYSAIYRSQEAMKAVMPLGIIATLLAIIVLTLIYAQLCTNLGIAAGVRYGALIGVFAVCAFVLHNYVNLNIGLRLTIAQAIAYFVEWLAVGVVISLVYRPKVS